MARATISVVITAYNEGEELHRTLRSVVDSTRGLAEVIVIDDGSDDGSCESLANCIVRVMRHETRIGVAASRDEGSRQARGDVLCYLDGHQRLSKNCLDRCAQLAIEQGAIACPDIKDYGRVRRRAHGAEFHLCPERGYFSAQWRQSLWRRGVNSVTALRAPPYLVPRSLYPSVAWSPAARGWGASEASVNLKSFFMGIPIFNTAGPLARHRFQKRASYPTTWEDMYRNQALIARICFDDATWFGYWLPKIFEPHLTDDTRAVLESPEVLAEHEQFLARKVRTDRQFWTDLARQAPPEGV